MNAPLDADPARPRSVRAVVGAARRSLVLARALECALLFVAALLLTRAAAVVSGLGDELARAWGVAVLSGTLCAAAWWCEHLQSSLAVARALDRRLHHEGALLTAFELEGRAALARTPTPTPLTPRPLTPMEELVRAHVLARLRVLPAVRAVLPSLLVPVAAPTVAALLLVLALDARTAPEPEPREALALGAGLERALALGAAEREGDGAVEDADGARTLAAIQQELRSLEPLLEERAAGPASDAERRRRSAALEALDRRLAERAARAPAASELRAHLEEARAWLDALRTELGAGSGTEGFAPGTAGESLTQAPSHGTISRPLSDPTPMSTSPVPPAEPAPALGLQAGSWWPSEYDAVVARWLELSRARSQR